MTRPRRPGRPPLPPGEAREIVKRVLLSRDTVEQAEAIMGEMSWSEWLRSLVEAEIRRRRR